MGFVLTVHPRPVSVLGLPNAVLLAALLLTPPRTWWLLFLTALPAHFALQIQNDVPSSMILCWFTSNSCEALIGATCVRALTRDPVRLDRLHTLIIFCVCAVFLGPLLSSFLDSAFVALSRWGQSSYWENWRVRFTSNALATLVIVPLAVTWFTGGFTALRRLRPKRGLEASVLCLALFACSLWIFDDIREANPALLYLPLPCLLWAAVRFGLRGTTVAISVVASLALWGATHGQGPFAAKSSEENAFSVQIFLICMSLPLLFLATSLEERNRVEETLRERDERIGLAEESANLALWSIDYERQETWMSQRGRALFRFPPDEPLSRELLLSQVHPEDRQKVDDAIELARGADQPFEIEYRLLRADGETRWILARGRYLRNARGELSGLIGVAIDVTAQVTTNLELRRQREEVAHLSRVALMGELTASLAHELNQPLTAIASNAAAGRRFLAHSALDVALVKELFNDIFADARRAGSVIHGIRDLVRKGEGSRSTVDLNDTVREVLRLLHSDLLRRAITAETALAADPTLVRADPIQLQQVLLNLVLNAFEAMEATPAADRRIRISTAAVDGFVQVDVRDHGGGLPPGDADQIFSHFFSTKPSGMGMGLAIVRAIIEAHDGELDAERLPDGARLFFRLPAA